MRLRRSSRRVVVSSCQTRANRKVVAPRQAMKEPGGRGKGVKASLAGYADAERPPMVPVKVSDVTGRVAVVSERICRRLEGGIVETQ